MPPPAPVHRLRSGSALPPMVTAPCGSRPRPLRRGRRTERRSPWTLPVSTSSPGSSPRLALVAGRSAPCWPAPSGCSACQSRRRLPGGRSAATSRTESARRGGARSVSRRTGAGSGNAGTTGMSPTLIPGNAARPRPRDPVATAVPRPMSAARTRTAAPASATRRRDAAAARSWGGAAPRTATAAPTSASQ